MALLQEWGLQNPHILAHDFGAATALRAYFLDAIRYASLTLFNAVAIAPWGSPFVQHVRQNQAAFAGMPGYKHEALLAVYLQTAAHQPLSNDAIKVYSAPWLGDLGQPAFYRQIAQMDQKFTDEVQSKYCRMDCPVNVLWGEKDGWIPLDKGKELAALISDSPIITIPDAGHLLQEDCPEAIVAAMLKRK